MSLYRGGGWGDGGYVTKITLVLEGYFIIIMLIVESFNHKICGYNACTYVCMWIAKCFKARLTSSI